MTNFKKLCPLCSNPLKLRQISFTTAVFICEALPCKYPVPGMQCIIIEKPTPMSAERPPKMETQDHLKTGKKIEQKNESNDNWFDNLYELQTQVTTIQTDNVQPGNDLNRTEMTSNYNYDEAEFNDFLNSIVVS